MPVLPKDDAPTFERKLSRRDSLKASSQTKQIGFDAPLVMIFCDSSSRNFYAGLIPVQHFFSISKERNYNKKLPEPRRVNTGKGGTAKKEAIRNVSDVALAMRVAFG